MTQDIIFYEHFEVNGEENVASVPLNGVRKIVFEVETDFAPDHDDFILPDGVEDVARPNFFLRVEGRVTEAFHPLMIHDSSDDEGDCLEVFNRTGLFAVEAEGLSEVRAVLTGDPPTDFGIFVTVKGVAIS